MRQRVSCPSQPGCKLLSGCGGLRVLSLVADFVTSALAQAKHIYSQIQVMGWTLFNVVLGNKKVPWCEPLRASQELVLAGLQAL